MALAELNIRIAAIYKDFDKSLRQVERSADRFANRIGRLGNDMTLALTVPFAAFGASAVKAAADAETLRLALQTTMKDAGRSIGEANMELQALRKAALAPGLDFEQAVRGSVRLQNVGFSAEKARDILVQLANAVAMSGGSAQELDGVTKQFGQMIAKGRIMQEDLGIIQENMPAISKAMEAAFGTKSAEKLRDMGVSAEQFIDGVTKQLAQLPRVEGGLRNAIVNAQSAISSFMATIGEGIAEAYGLSKASTNLSDSLGKVADMFRNLDPETRKSILNFGLYVIAAGPVLKIGSMLVSSGAAVINAFRGMADGAVGLVGKIGDLVTWFTGLNNTMRFTVVGGAIAAIGALYFAFTQLGDGVERALHVTRALEGVERSANEAVSEQRVRVQSLIGVLNDENETKERKLGALQKLNQISPEYFGGLKLEKDNVQGLNAAYDAYIENLLRAARVKAAEGKLIELDKKRLELAEKLAKTQAIKPKTAADFQDATGGFGSFNAFDPQGVGKEGNIAAIQEQIKAIEREFEAVGKVVKANADFSQSNIKKTATTNAATDASKEKTKAIKGETKSMKELLDMLDMLEGMREQEKKAYGAATQSTSPLQALPAQPLPTSIDNPVQTLFDDLDVRASTVAVDALTEVELSLLRWKAAMAAAKFEWDGMVESFKRGGAAQEAISQSVLGSIVQMSTSGSTSLKAFGASALKSGLDVAKSFAIQGIFAAVSKALVQLPFPAGIIAAGVVSGAAAALFNGLTNKIVPPKLAKGGIAYGETMATVGEYAGARVNPEVIAPLNTLQSILQTSGSGPSEVTVRGMVAGRDLLLVQERAEIARKRMTR